MKLFIAALLFSITATQAQAAEIRITGQAAAELYEKLDLPVTGVRDEHGGGVFAFAKYGEKVGCQKDITDGRVECWFLN